MPEEARSSPHAKLKNFNSHTNLPARIAPLEAPLRIKALHFQQLRDLKACRKMKISLQI